MASRGPEMSLQALPSLLDSLLPTAQKCRLSVSLADKETGSGRLNKLPQVSQLSGKGRIQTPAYLTPHLGLFALYHPSPALWALPVSWGTHWPWQGHLVSSRDESGCRVREGLADTDSSP